MSADTSKRSRFGRILRISAKVVLYTLIGILGLVLLIRALLPFILPYAAKKAGEPMGLSIRFDDFSLSMLAGDVTLEGLKIEPLPDQGMAVDVPLVALDRFAVDVAMRDLLSGKIRVPFVDIEGLRVRAERRADGTIALPKALEDKLNAPAEPEESEPEEPAPAEKPTDFTLPIEIERVTLAHIHLSAKDSAITPALETTLELDLRVADLGAPGKPFRVDLKAAAPNLLDLLRVQVSGVLEGATANANLAVDLSGLALAPIAPYLTPQGITPRASRLDFGLALTAGANATDRPIGELGVDVALNGLHLDADLVEAFALDRFELKVDRLSKVAIDVGNVLLQGLRARAVKQADGTLLAAGFHIDPNAKRPAAAPESAPEPPKPADTTPSEPPPVVKVGVVSLADLRFAVRDESMSPVIDLEPRLVELSTRDLVLDDKVSERPASVKLALAVPGILDRIAIDASTSVNGAARDVALALEATGLHANRLQPWLENSGIVVTIENGSLTLHTKARLQPALGAPERIDVALTGLSLKDGEELFGLDQFRVDSLTLGTDKISIGSVLLDDPRLSVKKEVDGTLVAVGVRVPPRVAAASSGSTTPAPVAETASTAPKSSDPASASKQPAIELGKFQWTRSNLRFEDASIPGARPLTLKDVEFALTEFGFDANGITNPAKIAFGATIDGLLRRLQIDGQATARLAGSDVDAALALGLVIDGIDTAALDPFIVGTGIDPTFATANFRLKLNALAKLVNGDIGAGVELTDLALTSGDDVLFGLGRLSVQDAQVKPDDIAIGAVEIGGIRVGAQRRADGSLIAAGVALVPPPASAAAPEAALASATESAAPPAEPAAASAAPRVRLGRFALDDVRVDWRDDAVTPMVATAVTTKIGLRDLELSPAPPAATFEVALGLEGSLDSLALQGSVVPNPKDLRVLANLGIRGLRPDAVAGYLASAPPITLKDGRLDAVLDARLAVATQGGQDAHLAVKDFVYRDGEQDPFLKFTAFDVTAPRLDAANGVFEVANLSLEGFEVSAEKRENGEMRLLGIALPPPTPAAESPVVEAPTEGVTPSAAPSDVAAAPVTAEAAKPLELFAQVANLDLAIAHVRFKDATQSVEPIDASLRLKSNGPIVIDSRERSDNPPPIGLDLVARLDPLGTEAALALRAEPLSAEPSVKVDWTISKIDQSKLATLVPGVFDTFSPPRVVDGVFQGSVEGRLAFRRRGPLDFDVSRGFAAIVQVKDVAFRDKPDGEILAGLEGLRASVKRMSPLSGEVHLDQIEIDTPRLSIVKRVDHLEVAGLKLALPTPPAEGAPMVEEAAAAETATPAPTVAVAPAEPAQPKPEIRVDELLAQGLGISFRDETVDPPLVVPLDKLEVEVRNLTTRALEQPIPIRFDIRMGAGLVELPKHPDHSKMLPVDLSSLTGAVGNVGSAVTGAVGDVGGVVTGAVGDVGGAVTGAVGDVGGAVTGAVGGLGNALGFGKKEESKEGATEAPATETPQSNAETPAKPDPATDPNSAEPKPAEPVELEQRVLLEEIELKGNVSLVPQPKGNVDFRLIGFELLGVKGSANSVGVTIQDGTLDLAVNTRLLGADGLVIDSVTGIQDLWMSEPKDGFLSKLLQLPAPLDVVIFALRDEEGVLRVPLRVAINPNDISVAGILGSVSSTLAQMIGRAIARSSLRALNTVGDIGGAAMGAVGLDSLGGDALNLGSKGLKTIGLGGLTGADDEPPLTGTNELKFRPGEVSLDAESYLLATRIASTLSRDAAAKVVLRHRFAKEDVDRAGDLVNPNLDSISEIIAGLRSRRSELEERRLKLSSDARLAFVIGDPFAGKQAADRLAGVLDELGRIEEAIDTLLDLMQPKAERRKEARARDGALAIAAQRLANVRRAVLAAGSPDLADRIEIQTARLTLDEAGGSAVIAEMKTEKRP